MDLSRPLPGGNDDPAALMRAFRLGVYSALRNGPL